MNKYRLVRKGELLQVGDYWSKDNVIENGWSIVGEPFDGIGELKRPIRNEKKKKRIDLEGRINAILYCAGFNKEKAIKDICKLIANNYRRRKKG